MLSEYPSFRKRIRKTKNWHATIVAIFLDNLSKILRPDLPEKFNGEHFEKIKIKTVITYVSMPYYSLFGEFQIVGPKLTKRKNDKKF